MNSYRYKITVEALTGAKGEPVEGRSLTSSMRRTMTTFWGLWRGCALGCRLMLIQPRALGVGLKVFSEVALMHRNDPMFASDSAGAERVYSCAEGEIGRGAACRFGHIVMKKRREGNSSGRDL